MWGYTMKNEKMFGGAFFGAIFYFSGAQGLAAIYRQQRRLANQRALDRLYREHYVVAIGSLMTCPTGRGEGG